MNTPAHVFLNLGILGNSIKPKMAGAIIFGSLFPDTPAFIFYFYEKVVLQTPENLIWAEKYQEPTWSYIFSIVHSFPPTIILIIGFWLLNHKWGFYFFVSVLLHQIGDFFLHNQDAHRQFLPLSDYRFISPVSYWDPNHFGHYFLAIEVVVSLFFGMRYLYRLQNRSLRIVIGLLLVVYIGNLSIAYFYWSGVGP